MILTKQPMTLSECAAYDYRTDQRNKPTGWGLVCRDRQVRGVSRKERRLRKQEAKRGSE